MTRDRSQLAERKGSVGFAAVIGGVAGATLAGHRGRRAAGVGAIAGAAGLAVSEAVARARQRPGEIPSLWQRIAMSGALVAPLGWAAGRVRRIGPLAVGTGTGTLAGLLGIRPQKVLLGPVFGLALGRAFAMRRSVCWPSGSGWRICRSSCRAKRVPPMSAPGTSATWQQRSAAVTSLT